MSYSLAQAQILIDLATQTLILPQHQKSYAISSGKNGIGEQENSGKTPRGWHKIASKFGHSAAKVLYKIKNLGERARDRLASKNYGDAKVS